MRYAHVTRDGRVICSVPGCGDMLGRIVRPWKNAWEEADGRVFGMRDNYFRYDQERGAWVVRDRARRWGYAKRRPFGYNRQMKESLNRQFRLYGIPPEAAADITPPDAVIGGWPPLPATFFCRNGHQSVVDPERLGLTWWEPTTP